MAVLSGTVAIGREPTLICVMGSGGVLVCPSGDGVRIGGADVACDGAAAGVPLPAGVATWVPGAAPFEMPVLGSDLNVAALYGITASGPAEVSFVAPQSRGV